LQSYFQKKKAAGEVTDIRAAGSSDFNTQSKKKRVSGASRRAKVPSRAVEDGSSAEEDTDSDDSRSNRVKGR